VSVFDRKALVFAMLDARCSKKTASRIEIGEWRIVVYFVVFWWLFLEIIGAIHRTLPTCKSMKDKEIKILEIFYFCF
jgi:hypothetical protein